jgi:hypothetical protein
MPHMPDWEALRDLAWQQAALFTTEQGAQLGFSSPLLTTSLSSGGESGTAAAVLAAGPTGPPREDARRPKLLLAI